MRPTYYWLRVKASFRPRLVRALPWPTITATVDSTEMTAVVS